MTNSDVSEITAFLLPLSEPYKFKSELLGQETESHSLNRMNWLLFTNVSERGDAQR